MKARRNRNVAVDYPDLQRLGISLDFKIPKRVPHEFRLEKMHLSIANHNVLHDLRLAVRISILRAGALEVQIFAVKRFGIANGNTFPVCRIDLKYGKAADVLARIVDRAIPLAQQQMRR